MNGPKFPSQQQDLGSQRRQIYQQRKGPQRDARDHKGHDIGQTGDGTGSQPRLGDERNAQGRQDHPSEKDAVPAGECVTLHDAPSLFF